ncbi:MAG: cytidylate kinase-like family protein [Muribaculaceae bacterium]|nr:cytidylate kinase-like family protein [Muribaculaceae bacterium]
MKDSANKTPDYVITVGRQFGSGGREFARHIAEAFGIPFYDKQLLLEAARHAGVDPGFFERSDEKFPGFTGGGISFNMGISAMPWYTPSSISDESIYRDMSDVIRKLADQGPCVIVGRSADYVLRDHNVPTVNLFLHADMDDCVKRILRRGDKLNPRDAKALAEKTNKLRANYYNFYTDKRWGMASSYDLSLNTSLMSMEGMVDLLAAYIKNRFGFDPRVSE